MHGRFLSGSQANVFDKPIGLLNNETHQTEGVYGFKRYYQIHPPDILMKFTLPLELLKLLWIRTHPQQHNLTITDDLLLHIQKIIRADIPHNLHMPDLLLHQQKLIRADILNSVIANITLHAIKQFRIPVIHNTFDIDLSIHAQKSIRIPEIFKAFTMGRFDFGNTISEIENYTVEDMNNVAMWRIIGEATSSYGLLLHMQKHMWADIHNTLHIPDLDMTIYKNMRPPPILHTLTIGNNLSEPLARIADIENLLISDIENMYIEDLIDGDARKGLLIHAQKQTRIPEVKQSLMIGSAFGAAHISDIENLTIDHVSGLTIEELVSYADNTRHGLRIQVVRPVHMDLEANEMRGGIHLGYKGTYISDVENLTINVVENLTIDEFVHYSDEFHQGLRMKVVKYLAPSYLSDVEGLTISQIENKTIENFGFKPSVQ